MFMASSNHFLKIINSLEVFWWLFPSLLGALGSGSLVHHIFKLTCLQSEHHGMGWLSISAFWVLWSQTITSKNKKQQQNKTKKSSLEVERLVQRYEHVSDSLSSRLSCSPEKSHQPSVHFLLEVSKFLFSQGLSRCFSTQSFTFQETPSQDTVSPYFLQRCEGVQEKYKTHMAAKAQGLRAALPLGYDRDHPPSAGTDCPRWPRGSRFPITDRPLHILRRGRT